MIFDEKNCENQPMKVRKRKENIHVLDFSICSDKLPGNCQI